MTASELRGPRWRAMINYTWLEELASESNTNRHKIIYVGKGRRQASTCETIYKFGMIISQYLKIYVFVWARVLCGTRKHQSASVDCSGVIQKIHMRKIRLGQGRVHDAESDRFHD